MQVYLIRHTTPAVAKDICYGQTDLDIDKILFENELAIIQKKLPQDIETVYSSPLKRCMTLARKLSSNPKTDERLMELNFGKWENKKWNKLGETELNHWMADFVNVNPPEGESYATLHERTAKFMEMLLHAPYKKVAVVTHAGNIRSMISFVLDLPLQNSFRIELNYGTVVKLQIEKDKCLCKLVSMQ